MVEKHLSMYKEFIEKNGNSPNVCAMYYKRVRTFLGKRPDAVDADENGLRAIVDDYIASLKPTSGVEVTATAVRYYWTMRFGKRYFNRFDPADYPENPEIERVCAEFRRHLEDKGRLSESTVRGRVAKVRQYLYIMFGGGSFDPSMVDLESALKYISEAISHAAASTKSGFCTEIRAFARFLCESGHEETAGPIAKISLKGPSPSDPLPRCMPDDDYEALASSIDTGTERGKRDLAMLCLMGNLGLRRSDVALLDLDDVDWANGILHVRNSKSISDRSIPIDSRTGGALEDYALNGRPRQAESRSLFLPTGNEWGELEMTFTQVGGAIGLQAQKAGIPFEGTHSLRRAVATNMSNNGAPIKPIADLLGHESIVTTMGYLRVNVESLRKAAAPWPKEVSQ